MRICRASVASRSASSLAASEGADLARRELAPRAGAEPAKLERAEPHAAKPQHAEPDRGAHAADLALPSGVQNHAERRPARAAGHRHARGTGQPFLERNATPKGGDRAGGDGAGDAHLVLALVPVAG